MEKCLYWYRKALYTKQSQLRGKQAACCETCGWTEQLCGRAYRVGGAKVDADDGAHGLIGERDCGEGQAQAELGEHLAGTAPMSSCLRLRL
jgi:hypothetical protein